MIRVQTLGTAVIETDTLSLTPGAPRKFGLLLYLCAEAGRPAPKAMLLDLMFPAQSESNARHSLRELLYQLRNAGVMLATGPDGIGLRPSDVHFDYDELARSERLTVEQVRAVAGGFLPGYSPDDSEAFSDWLSAYRARRSIELCRALSREIERSKAVADWAGAERVARACLVLDPMHEPAIFALADMLTVGGAKAQGAAVIDRYIEDSGSLPPELKAAALRHKRRLGERAPERFQTATAAPFVGREQEMLRLAKHLEKALVGEPQCLVLSGDPGIGKTRLATEFSTRAMLQGVVVERVGARPHDMLHPMGAFVDLVPRLVELPGAAGCAPESMAVLRRLSRHDADHSDDMMTAVRQSEAVSTAIVRAISDVVDAVTSEQPLLLWFDDAHWLDETSISVVSTLTRSRDPRRLLVVMTSRDPATANLLARQAADPVVIRVDPLDRVVAGSLVDTALGDQQSTADDSRSWILDAAAGNPFYLNCLVNHLRQTGERFTIPASVSQFVDQRLAALSETAAIVLETCVLLGKYATLERLSSALEMQQFPLLGAMRELEKARLIEKSEEQLQAAHWLIADAVRRNATRLATQLAHRRIAEMLIDEATQSQSAAVLWDCGEHWIAAGDFTRAVEVMRQCSRHALDIGRPREASELLLRAGELAPSPLKIGLAEEGVRVAAGAAEHELVLRGVDMLRMCGMPAAHDDIEIAELNALSIIDGSEADPAGRLMNCLNSPAASEQHRIEVGLVLMMLCDHHGNLDLAAKAFSLIDLRNEPESMADKITFLTFLLVYHAAFGIAGEGVRVARRLLALGSGTSLDARSDLHRKAANVFWTAGLVDEAVVSLSDAYSHAKAAGLRRAEFTTALGCAGICNDVRDDIAARVWWNRAEKVADEIPEFRANQYYVFIATELAAVECGVDEIRKVHNCARSVLSNATNERAQRWLFALQMLERHVSGQPIDADAVSNLTKGHTSTASADFELAVAIRILNSSGQAELAQRVFDDHLKTRRGGGQPLLRALQEAIRAGHVELNPGAGGLTSVRGAKSA